MKRLFPISLALLLAIGSLGHVFSAAFCPSALGRECCLTTVSNHTHASFSSHEDMAMQGTPTDGAEAMGGVGTKEMTMDEDGMPMDDKSKTTSPASDDDAITSKFELPVEPCNHCTSHSGILNAPVSSVSASDQSNKDLGSVRPVSRFHIPSATTVSQSGLPREHAPPSSATARHILVSVFLI